MQKDLGTYRKSYEKSALDETTAPENPMSLFETWFNEVEDSGGVEEPNAMTLSTIGIDGFPKNRVVLLKQFNAEGFIFYTNYSSEKGKAIEQIPNVCLSFFWPNLERQIIVKGNAEKTSEEVSDNYFNARPEGSRLGAIVSNQSQVIPSRKVLEQKLEKLKDTYKNKPIARPEYWGGYVVRPVSIEFWQGRPNRLHDRIRYATDEGMWKLERLAP